MNNQPIDNSQSLSAWSRPIIPRFQLPRVTPEERALQERKDGAVVEFMERIVRLLYPHLNVEIFTTGGARGTDAIRFRIGQEQTKLVRQVLASLNSFLMAYFQTNISLLTVDFDRAGRPYGSFTSTFARLINNTQADDFIGSLHIDENLQRQLEDVARLLELYAEEANNFPDLFMYISYNPENQAFFITCQADDFVEPFDINSIPRSRTLDAIDPTIVDRIRYSIDRAANPILDPVRIPIHLQTLRPINLGRKGLDHSVLVYNQMRTNISEMPDFPEEFPKGILGTLMPMCNSKDLVYALLIYNQMCEIEIKAGMQNCPEEFPGDIIWNILKYMCNKKDQEFMDRDLYSTPIAADVTATSTGWGSGGKAIAMGMSESATSTTLSLLAEDVAVPLPQVSSVVQALIAARTTMTAERAVTTVVSGDATLSVTGRGIAAARNGTLAAARITPVLTPGMLAAAAAERRRMVTTNVADVTETVVQGDARLPQDEQKDTSTPHTTR